MKNRNIKFYILIFTYLISAFSMNALSQPLIDYLPLLPKPVQSELAEGSYTITRETHMLVSGEGATEDAEFLNAYFEQYYGFTLKVSPAKKFRNGSIHIRKITDNDKYRKDEYSLKVHPSGIEIESGDGAGAFYGIQTLIQLLPPGRSASLVIPSLSIKDYPRFSWRGMHLDVSRHFYSVDFIKKYIDHIASYKMNTFHWHLTDDQGWRIEILKYPGLAKKGSSRDGTLIGHLGSMPQRFDSIPYGGFYTQEQIRDIVSYATDRHVSIVPEIEMPGHALAALAAYPEFSCTGGPFEVSQKWGIFQDVFCNKDETFSFLADVLGEVAGLFPGEYIHIGGDECPKDRWKQCNTCRSVMIKEGLKDEYELQSYFIHRVEKILRDLNKKLIGWDEILEGGLAADATVMSWRGYKGGVDAASMGHDVVMSPTSFCYFDFYQSRLPGEPLSIGGYLPLDRVYSFEPVPDVLDEKNRKHILGAQANLWTEYIKTPEHVEYMIMPRMSALSEVLWSPAEKRNYDDYTRRLTGHFKLLDFKKVKYSTAVFDINEFVYPHGNTGALSIELSSPYKHGKIYYTINGDEPVLSSTPYNERIVVDQSVGVRAKVFDGANVRGKEYSRVFRINLATGKEIILARPPHEEYSRGGGFTLVNGVLGNLPWMGSDWLGFLGEDFEATIDLGKSMTVSKVGIDALRDENSWIYFPVEAEVLGSEDGNIFSSLTKLEGDAINKDKRLIALQFEKTSTRYIKVKAKNFGIIPDNRPGAGRPAWLLIDEITID